MYNNVSNSSYKSSVPLNLMTPEEFRSSPLKKDVDDFSGKDDNSEINVINTYIYIHIFYVSNQSFSNVQIKNSWVASTFVGFEEVF